MIFEPASYPRVLVHCIARDKLIALSMGEFIVTLMYRRAEHLCEIEFPSASLPASPPMDEFKKWNLHVVCS